MMHLPYRMAVALLLSAAATSVPAAAQQPLTLDRALALSLEGQPGLSAYTRTAKAFEEAAVAARQLPDFTLRAGIQNLPVQGPDAFSLDKDFMTMRFIGIGREQVRRSKRQAEASRLLAEGDVALAEQQLLARRIQRDVMLGWTATVEGIEKQEALRALIDKLRARLDATEAAIPTGQAGVADAVGIRAEIAAARAEVEQAEGVEAAGRAALSRWIGEASRQPLSGALPICRPPPQDAALAFLDRHPQLEVARRQNRVAERAITVARADRKPDWGWSVMYGNRGRGEPDMVTLELSIDLPLNRARLQNRRVGEASELAAAALDSSDDARREIAADYRRALAEWTAAERRYATTSNDTLPALIAAEQALEARLAGGGGDLQSLLTASERTTRTSLELVERRAELARASADFVYFVEECGR